MNSRRTFASPSAGAEVEEHRILRFGLEPAIVVVPQVVQPPPRLQEVLVRPMPVDLDRLAVEARFQKRLSAVLLLSVVTRSSYS